MHDGNREDGSRRRPQRSGVRQLPHSSTGSRTAAAAQRLPPNGDYGTARNAPPPDDSSGALSAIAYYFSDV
jgi:hypothetical protein